MPTNWLFNNQCYWPNLKQPGRQLFKKTAQPDPTSWKTYPCRVKKYFKTYQEALDREMALSDLSSVECSGDENVYRNKRISRRDLLTLRENSLSPPPPLNSDNELELPPPEAECKPSTSKAINIEDLEVVSVDDQTFKNSSTEKILALVVETNLLVKRNHAALKEIKECMAHGKSNQDPSASLSFIKELTLPLDTLPQLENLEGELLKETNSSQMLNWFKMQGGKDYRNLIKRCLIALFTNNLARICSWTGAKGNFPLCNLTVFGILQDASGQIFSNSKSNFETVVKEWFRMANQRYQRQLLLNNKP